MPSKNLSGCSAQTPMPSNASRSQLCEKVIIVSWTLTNFHFLLQARNGITRTNEAEFELSIVYLCITDLECSVTSVDPILWREATAALLRHQMICMVMFV